MASIFKRHGQGSWIISYFDAKGVRREKSSGTTDRKAAGLIASKLETGVALRRGGVIDDRQAHFIEQDRRPIAEHVREYLAHCRRSELSDSSVDSKERNLDRLIKDIAATRLGDLSVDNVERHLAHLRAKKQRARTVNESRKQVIAFLNWAFKTSRIEANPLKMIPRLDESIDRGRVRRALTDDELARLVAVGRERGRAAWYLTAALAGLRRGELATLTWGAVDLVAGFITVRNSKAGREDIVPLHADLAAELMRIKPAAVLPTARVFPTIVTHRTRGLDFKRAEIKDKDESGRYADLHALRTTMGTRLARAGIAPQVTRVLMRHRSLATTTTHYTALERADSVGAINRLAGIEKTQEEAVTRAAVGCDSPTATNAADSSPPPVPSLPLHPPSPSTMTDSASNGEPQQFPQHSPQFCQQSAHESPHRNASDRNEPSRSEAAASASDCVASDVSDDAVREDAMVGASRFERPTSCSQGAQPASQVLETKGFAPATQRAPAVSPAVGRVNDPLLDRLVAAWSTLPEHVRLTVGALLDAVAARER